MREVSCFNCLDFEINKSLDFSNQLEKVLKKAESSAHMVSGIFRNLEVTCCEKIVLYFNTNIRSQIFGLEFFPLSHIESKISQLQYSFVKSIFDLPQGFPKIFIELMFICFEKSDFVLKRRVKLCIIHKSLFFFVALMDLVSM